jgi:spore coat protein U-like protein
MLRTALLHVLTVMSLLLYSAVSAGAACTISASGVAFGTYDVFSPVPLSSTGTVTFTCQKPDKRIMVTFSTGSSGTYTDRTMVQAGNVLTYNLYRTSSYTTVWGDGSRGTGYYFDNNPRDNVMVSLTVYGRIPPQQDVPGGSYSDTVQVLIDF